MLLNLQQTINDFKCKIKELIDFTENLEILTCQDVVNCLGDVTGAGDITVTGNYTDGWVISFTETPETKLVVTTDGNTTGVTQSGTADHTVDIVILSTDVDNLITSGSDGGVYLDCDNVLSCIPEPPKVSANWDALGEEFSLTIVDNCDGDVTNDEVGFSVTVNGNTIVTFPEVLNDGSLVTFTGLDIASTTDNIIFDQNIEDFLLANGYTVQENDLVNIVPTVTDNCGLSNTGLPISYLSPITDFYTDDPNNPTQQIHTAVDGTETCVPKCVSYLAGPQGDRIFTSNCKFMHTDLATGDNPCVVSGTTFPGLSVWKLKANSLNQDTIVHLSADGVLTYELLDCENPSVTSFDYCIECPDGTTFTNTVNVIYTPPPIGEIRLDKDFTPNNVQVGDTVELQLTICNSGTGNILNPSVTDVLPTGLTFAGTGGFPITGTLDATTVPGTVVWTPGVTLAPDECVSQSFFVDVTTTDIYFDNFANAVADDGNGGITQDYDSDTLTQEPSPAVTIAHDVTGGPDNIVTNILFEKDAGSTPADINDCITINKTLNGNTFTYSGQWGTNIPTVFLESCGVYGGTQTWSPTGEWVLDGWAKNFDGVNPPDPALAFPIEWEAIIDRNCTGNTASAIDEVCTFSTSTADNNTINDPVQSLTVGNVTPPVVGGVCNVSGPDRTTILASGMVTSQSGRWVFNAANEGNIVAVADCNGTRIDLATPIMYTGGTPTATGIFWSMYNAFIAAGLNVANTLPTPYVTYDSTITRWYEIPVLQNEGQAAYDLIFGRIGMITYCDPTCAPTKIFIESLDGTSTAEICWVELPYLKR